MATWVIVVDDDTANLKMAGQILSRNNMRVTALRSGKALLDYVESKGQPDIVLLDIKMPEMDGFETLEKFREWEHARAFEEAPVIFLTADEETETETHSFEAGVSDYIRKPFNPDILLRRINNIVAKQSRINDLRTEATTDKLTGFLNKSAAIDELGRLCETQTGSLLMIDLDSFKLVNDLHGHDVGDKVLITFASLISEMVPDGSRCARLGGDEFAAFCPGLVKEEKMKEIAKALNERLLSDTAEFIGEGHGIPLGTSIGIALVPAQGTEYEMLIKLADKALYHVKQNGKHGCAVFSESMSGITSVEADLKTLSAIIGERNIPNSALRLEKDLFSCVYQYIMRYIIRNQKNACKVLFTLGKGTVTDPDEYESLCEKFGDHVKDRLRKSDILMRNRQNQYFVFLTDIREASIGMVVGNIIRSWHEKYGELVVITNETEYVGGTANFVKMSGAVTIAVVDDDNANLMVASRVLQKGGFDVVTYTSGQELLDYAEKTIPSLVLLDINMPGLNGFQTLEKLRTMSKEAADIPVIFLTADENADSEGKGLQLGAMDFIKKPFVPDVLLLRVRHIIELVTLQRSLSNEVERKSRENRNLFMHVVHSLADAIDAKDTYTNGHSGRVADYSREIARRVGYSEKEQNNIYMMGLLHDVGKIGVPDAVINKPAKLTDEEFALIKNHPVMGARILENIKEMPKLATGARYHHERFAGDGYPDGLSGDNIPEEARIIAVADAYDAMTSRRSYRDVLSQERVRSEIEKGIGTQFDPRFAKVMLEMIDEDKDYRMRETE